MRRVLNNLVENAVKYADADPLKVMISLAVEDGAAILKVSDNGVGVEEGKLPFIFERFYRADESRSSRSEGSGLGLYIVKYIVEAHGGEVTAYNNNGLCLTIRLPLSNPPKS
jgi:signal transduction histidine kinase